MRGNSYATPATIALAGLDADYVDRFTHPVSRSATPERWARQMFGDAPSRAERFIWSGLLGLRLLPSPSDDTVAGWLIAGRDEDWIRLTTSSHIVSAVLLVQTGSDELALTTVIRYENPVGRAVWTVLSPIHRGIAPGLLRRVAQTPSGS